MERFAVRCKKCGSEDVTVELADDGACSDPECCGSPSYYIDVTCNQCRAYESAR